jgi:hypothetical protein
LTQWKLRARIARRRDFCDASAMRPLRSLSFDAVVGLLGHSAEQMPDARDPDAITYTMRDAVMSAFAVFFFQHPSLLEFERRHKRTRQRCNLETMFGVTDVPSDTRLREILDVADPEAVREVLGEVVERMRRIKWLERFKTTVGGTSYLTMVLDGSEYFHSTKIHCPSCLRQTHGSGTVHYSHQVLAATLVKSSSHQILPFDAEQIGNSDGADKQDCETNAAKRLLRRVRDEHPRLNLIVGGDAIYAHEPMVELLAQQRIRFVLGVKPGSQPETFEWVEELEGTGGVTHGRYEEGSGPLSKRRWVEYRYASEVPLKQESDLRVTFVEAWVRNHRGEQLYHNSWVTDLEVTAETVREVIRIGRSRWKIENEHFNVHKNGGYELEHNFGHGKTNLSWMLYLLNLLAFVLHQILQMGDHQYALCRAGASLRELWGDIRTLIKKLVFESWDAMLAFLLDDTVPEDA